MSGQAHPNLRIEPKQGTPVGGVAFTGTADVEFDFPMQSFIPDTAGTVKVKTIDNSDLTLTVLQGVQYWIRFVKVFDVGTTVAGNALY